MTSSEELNQKLVKLTETPEGERNPSWESQFFQALSRANLELLSQDPQQGPDGWPYLMAQTSLQAGESVQKMIQWLSQKGMGLAVNPQKDYPDYIFSYGMIWSFRETGFFFRDTEASLEGSVELSKNLIKHAGTPTESYLPGYVRKILREFFRDQGVFTPKVLVLSSDGINYELAISLDSIGNPKAEEHASVAEAIGWFLPPHYSLILINEKDLPPFTEL